MATLTGNNVTISGPGYARLRIEWQLAGQNIGGNYSTINWQAYVDFFNSDAQLDNGHVNWNGGALYNNGGRVYNYSGNFSNHTIGMGSGSFNIGHDGGGNATLNMNGSVAVYQSGTSSANGNWGLPTIPRYANITALNASNVSDVGFQINVSVDNTCNFLQISLEDGVGWRDVFGGNFSNYSVAVGRSGLLGVDLLSERLYNFRARVRRADSGLWTESGVASIITLAQSRFFDTMGL